jgi:two-component system phosphate regulon sensor histidine kinase PhoR
MGEVKLRLEGLSMKDVAESALVLTAARAAEKGIVIRGDIQDDLPLIAADRDRLTQILLNIIDNAVKYTPNGGMVTLAASQEGDNFLALRISDTGRGIPEAEIPRLGERFYRVDKTRSRELGGTGLGLSIVKHLMKAHGGRMNISSVFGKGTTVSLFFPVFPKEEVNS